MTEKRYSHDAIVIVDHLKKDLIYIDGKDELLELAEYVDRLQEENEQLKQRNDKQCNQLKQLWELIEDEDYNTLRSMLNQRETDEKLLQKEWGTYSD